MKNVVLVIIALFSASLIYAQSEIPVNSAEAVLPKLYKIPYLVEPGDSLQTIHKHFVFHESVIPEDAPMNEMTFKHNPQIDDWKIPTEGALVYIYISHEFLDMTKYQAYLENNEKKLAKFKADQETENSPPGPLPEGFKASVFYMASYGKFTQKDPKRADVDFYQNSPITLGGMLSYYPKESNWSFASSAYLSYLLASANNLDDSNVTVAPEIGLTFYPEYRFEKYNFTGFFGIDFERFSTFNMGGIQQDRKILLDQNQVLYATVGLSKLVHIFKSPFFTKISFSKSISSTNTPHSDGLDSEGDYSGYKFLWYMNKKLNEKYYVSTLLKYHVMSGPSDLETLRVGIGLGYIFGK